MANSRASWKSLPCSMSVTPSARMAAFFSTELPSGTTMVQATPWLRAAQPMLCPWLPRVALITSRGMAPRRASWSKYVRPPRILKAPTGVWFSCLSQQSVPRRSLSRPQRYWGVGGKSRYTTCAAASMSARVGRRGAVSRRAFMRRLSFR